jgi:predicted TPR repeat methyltransferase
LIYIGDLSHLFQALSEFAKPGALFLFSTEHDDSPTIGYALRETGRYSHAYSYVEALCERHGATIVSFHTDNLRFDAGEMLVGGMYLLRFGA